MEPEPEPEPEPLQQAQPLSSSQKKRARKARQKARRRAEAAASTPPEPIQRYSELATQLNAPVAVYVAPGCPEKGKGCFTLRSIASGEKLWCEAPMLSVQHEANNATVATCAECSRWVGTPEAVLNGVIRWAEAATQCSMATDQPPAALAPLPPPPGSVVCEEMCGAVYCSEECRRVAWAIHHRMLCTGCGVGGTPETLSKGAALHRGALLCYEQLGEEHGCQEVLSLLARSVVDVLGGWEADGRTPAALAAAMNPYESLYSLPWWDVPRSDPHDTEEAQLRHIVKEAARLLDLALLPCHRREAPELFDVERCARMLGAFESNLLSVEVECPAIRQLRELPQANQRESKLELHKSVNNETGLHCGTVLYPRELLARAAEVVSSASTCDVPAEDVLPNNKQTKAMRHGRQNRRGQDTCSGDEVSTSMLSSSWPCSEGVGLFDLISTLNHSCEPNCVVSYRDGCHTATVTATQPLATGDELLISYIDETAPLSDRRNQLVEYGFECRCGRCCEEQAEDVNMPIHGNCD